MNYDERELGVYRCGRPVKRWYDMRTGEGIGASYVRGDDGRWYLLW